jgi:hypothetical protein
MKLKVLLPSLIIFASCMVNVANAKLIHSYDFSGNTKDSTGSNNGTNYGAVLTTDRHGNSNSAYNFDGNDSIVANFTSPITATFTMWASWGGTNGDMLFNSGTNGTGPDLFFHENIISWNTWDSSNNPFGNISSSNISDGNFHHYAVVNDALNSMTTLYIDGTFFGTADYRYQSNGTFTIGAAGSSGSYGWGGTIDEVRIFDTALDINEVKLSMKSTAVSAPPTLAILSLGLIGLSLRRFKKQA